MAVRFDGVSKVFPDGTVALDALDLEFDTGEFLVLLGPSGSGKTTACRILAGLETPSAGRVHVDGRDITELPPRLREMGMVFQNYALYPHKTVAENIAYPLRIRGVRRRERHRRVQEMAELLRIEELLERRPAQLSGGQAQRVAVARALVWRPRICLMDEPLSNLDALLRLHTRTELKKLYQTLNQTGSRQTVVFVTHDQEEALTLGTRIALLHQGKLLQYDSPRTIYREPASRFVAEFIGRPAMNTLDGRIDHGVFRCEGLELPVPERPDGPVTLGIRPEQIQLADNGEPDSHGFTVEVIEPVEPDTLLFVKRGATGLVVRTQREVAELRPGSPLGLKLPATALHFFDAETGARLP